LISNKVRSDVSMSNFDPAKDVYLNINAFSQPAPTRWQRPQETAQRAQAGAL
jgi:hypothetical protein